MPITFDESRAHSHHLNCRHKNKFTVEEAAQQLWQRPEDHGFEIYICTNCEHLHFGHGRAEKAQIRKEQQERRDRGKVIRMLGSACHYIKHRGMDNRRAREILNAAMAEVGGNVGRIDKPVTVAEAIDRIYKKKA